MEKATKWDDVFFASHSHDDQQQYDLYRSTPASSSPVMVALMMEAELEKARRQVMELEEERRVMTKRLDRFLRKLSEEKASWKARVRDKARRAVSGLSEDLIAERRHRRHLEQANARLLRDLSEARSSATQQAERYDAERKAREVMEEACSELTREVEEDQAEVELLRRECVRMREEVEEERRMLQVAEVWREERVQMKLSDAKLALESKYTQLNRLQAEMEAFLLLRNNNDSSKDGHDHQQHQQVDVDSVLEHFRRKDHHHHHASNKDDDAAGRRRYSSPVASPASSRSNSVLQSDVSPATDLFLANIDDDDMYGNLLEMDYDGGRDSSCSWVGTSDRSAASVPNGNGTTAEARSSGASRRSVVGKSNTALIRRLWRSAITESRNKTGGGGRPIYGGAWSPASEYRRSSAAAEALAPPPPPAVVAGEQYGCSSASGLAVLPPQQHGHGRGHGRQSLKEKLMAARMDDQKPLHAGKQKP